MSHTIRRSIWGCLGLALMLALPALAQTTADLPMSIADGSVGESSHTVYRYVAASAGVLTVAVRAEGDDCDLKISFADDEGQPLGDDASFDGDLGGNYGHEQGLVTIPRAGTYHVYIMNSREAVDYKIGASFLAFPGTESGAVDPDGKPSQARALEMGAKVDDSIGGDGDQWDWYMVTLPEAGRYAVETMSDEECDLVIEHYLKGEYASAETAVDFDYDDNYAHEILVLEGEAGDVFLVRVKIHFLATSASYSVELRAAKEGESNDGPGWDDEGMDD